MALKFNELRELVTTLSQTDISELTLKGADFELTLRKQGAIVSAAAPAITVTPQDQPLTPPVIPAIQPVSSTPPAPAPTPPPSVDSNLLEITSPMVGTFYRSPAPEESSFVEIGDRIIGLASSGVHSNGFSLVRKIIAEAERPNGQKGYDWAETPEALDGKSLGDVLLTPTQLYVKPVLAALKSDLAIHAMAHVTGGGLPENLPRCLAAGQSIQLAPNSWPVLPIFDWLQQAGQVSLPDMFNTFNMGVGFVVIVPPADEAAACEQFSAAGISAYRLGEVVAGFGEVLGLPEA